MNIRRFKPAHFVKGVRQLAFEKRGPEMPWLTPAAVLLLNGIGDTRLWIKPAPC
jgi:hypothetical protein